MGSMLSWRSPRGVPFALPAGLLAVALGSALLAACVPATGLPETCDDAAVTLQATLADDELDPATLEVCRGQQVTIDVAVEQDAVLHFHGYDEEIPAREVHDGETVKLTFEAAHAGQFPIEIHTTDEAETTVGTFIVHEG
jgi:Cupredoxin-like domain